MNVISTPTRRLLALSRLAGVGPATLRKIAAVPDFEQLDIRELSSQMPALERATDDPSAWDAAQEDAAKQIQEAGKYEACILSAKDADYPRLLASTKDDPFLLYVRGNLAPNANGSVAIIGTREPTQHGQLIATRITQFFAENHWSVVSGLAIGCDAIAHQSALDAGCHTVAVLAHGLQMIAPVRHRKLAEDILSAGGALVSEYPFGREVQKQQYVKRDRTQAGMAQGVVMIQSDLTGGSLHASRAALDYGRWLAVPYPTPKDRERGESKIQANLVIAEGSDAQRSELLRCTTGALERIIVLGSKEDYLLMIEERGTELLDKDRAPHREKRTPATPSTTQHVARDEEPLAARVPIETAGEATTRAVSESGQRQLTDASRDAHAPAEAETIPLPQESLFAEFSEGTQPADKDANESVQSHLKVLGLPAKNLTKSATVRTLINQPPVAPALTTLLEYLQARLDTVELAHQQLKHSSSTEGRQLFQLAIDDVLSQMERAADFLLVLESIKDPELAINHTGSDDTFPAWKRQIGMLTEVGRDALRQRERTFFATLANLQSSSLRRLLWASSCQSEHAITEKGGDLSTAQRVEIATEGIGSSHGESVSLEDLVENFNRLVRRALYA
jgi:DNA processing protein